MTVGVHAVRGLRVMASMPPSLSSTLLPSMLAQGPLLQAVFHHKQLLAVATGHTCTHVPSIRTNTHACALTHTSVTCVSA
jgi:hypothetical protein